MPRNPTAGQKRKRFALSTASSDLDSPPRIPKAKKKAPSLARAATPSTDEASDFAPPGSSPTESSEEAQYGKNDIVSCICGDTEEHGAMVACDICDEWSHSVCVGIYPAEASTREFHCGKCVDDSTFNMTVEDSKPVLSSPLPHEAAKRTRAAGENKDLQLKHGSREATKPTRASRGQRGFELKPAYDRASLDASMLHRNIHLESENARQKLLLDAAEEHSRRFLVQKLKQQEDYARLLEFELAHEQGRNKEMQALLINDLGEDRVEALVKQMELKMKEKESPAVGSQENVRERVQARIEANRRASRAE